MHTTSKLFVQFYDVLFELKVTKILKELVHLDRTIDILHLKRKSYRQNLENVYLFQLAPNSHILKQLVLSCYNGVVVEVID